VLDDDISDAIADAIDGESRDKDHTDGDGQDALATALGNDAGFVEEAGHHLYDTLGQTLDTSTQQGGATALRTSTFRQRKVRPKNGRGSYLRVSRSLRAGRWKVSDG